MDTSTVSQKIQNNPRSVVVDLWAAWCGPCKAAKPILEQLSKEYAGRVDLWENNADDSHDLLPKLSAYGIPTLIAYRDGKELTRYIGAKPANALKNLFETLAIGGIPGPVTIAVRDRIFRIAAGLAIVCIGWIMNSSWLLFIFGRHVHV
jgi:thioredoxin